MKLLAITALFLLTFSSAYQANITTIFRENFSNNCTRLQGSGRIGDFPNVFPMQRIFYPDPAINHLVQYFHCIDVIITRLPQHFDHPQVVTFGTERLTKPGNRPIVETFIGIEMSAEGQFVAVRDNNGTCEAFVINFITSDVDGYSGVVCPIFADNQVNNVYIVTKERFPTNEVVEYYKGPMDAIFGQLPYNIVDHTDCFDEE